MLGGMKIVCGRGRGIHKNITAADNNLIWLNSFHNHVTKRFVRFRPWAEGSCNAPKPVSQVSEGLDESVAAWGVHVVSSDADVYARRMSIRVCSREAEKIKKLLE